MNYILLFLVSILIWSCNRDDLGKSNQDLVVDFSNEKSIADGLERFEVTLSFETKKGSEYSANENHPSYKWKLEGFAKGEYHLVIHSPGNFDRLRITLAESGEVFRERTVYLRDIGEDRLIEF